MRYRPVFRGHLEGFAVKYMKANHWRIKQRCPEWEDAMQEARMVYMHCVRMYSDTHKASTSKHFMALYKRCLINHVINLSKKDTNCRHFWNQFETEEQEHTETQALQGETENAGVLLTLVRQAPQEVSLTLMLLLNAPTEVLDLVYKGNSMRSSEHSRRLGALLGLPEGSDPLKATRQYLLENRV